MRYGWLLTLFAILIVVIFSNKIAPAKNDLMGMITLQPYIKPELVKQSGRQVLVAKIYSTYPLNDHRYLTIAAGEADGVVQGMVVTTDGNQLLGQVTEVFEHYSNVRTIFDQSWQISVRIGQGQSDALLVSGQQPQLTMIDKKSVILEGDPVISASRDFPYGLKIGTISGVQNANEVSFQRGILDVPYQVNDLKEVAVIIK